MSRSLPDRFVRYIRRRRLILAGDHVMVALSGGVDSMVLLHLLRGCAQQLRITLSAAHYDHAIRPGSADDAAWVAGICKAWEIPLRTERSTGALYGAAAARTARYAFLDESARQLGATRIATAHHADDQIETVLFRILRGTGIAGLAGIPVRRGRIIRPLLRFHKKELEDYARTHGIAYREDESNLTDKYARNRIRRALIPVMQTIRPDAPAAILLLSRHAARTERAWRRVIDGLSDEIVLNRERGKSELAREKFLKYDAEIRARVLRAELRRFGYVPDRAGMRDMLRFIVRSRSGTSVDIGAGLRLERSYDVVRIARPTAAPDEAVVRITDCEPGTARARIGGREWDVLWTTSPNSAPNNLSASFACDALEFPLEVRGWHAGDRMRFPYGSKKLKKVFAEARVPAHERATVPVVADAAGRVYWVAGVARSTDALVGAGDRALTITVSHVER